MESINTRLALIGINHKSSKIAEREHLLLNSKEESEFAEKLFSLNEVEGVMILSTCNRLEFYFSLKNEIDPFDLIERIYFEKNIDISDYEHIFYTFREIEVTRHIFRVISGLDSLVLGEFQIQGQVREAYSKACKLKVVDKMLHKLLHAAFRTGKRVRSETSIAEGRRSVSGMAAQLMIDNLQKSDTICIIGVNENTTIMAEKLTYAGFSSFLFVNRTKYKAEILAEQFGGQAKGLDDLKSALENSNAVFSSTGASEYIISSKLIKELSQESKCPSLMIDMAVPRDIENSYIPENLKLYDIDDLRLYLEEQKRNQLEALPEAEKIVEDEVKVFQAWSETRTNTILEPYSEKFELIRQQLIEEYRTQFSEKNIEKVDKLTRSLIHRMQSTFVRALLRTNQELKVFLQHRDSM
ncbi:glutamyl-tRNA reductase [Bacteroidetes/Chlorobi group bacterium ChocPot_Mid]|nr:MAG: glutamyl-tRNA reductase [Bacteroidetes/Chlorobi group bacterium ChocPot_Mid]